MKRIMFNDRFGLTDAVIEGKKTVIRRFISDRIKDHYYAYDDYYEVCCSPAEIICGRTYELEFFERYKPYKVGEIVAIAQSYYSVMASRVKVPYKFDINLTSHKGWCSKMFVKAELMPHQIRILSVRVERLHDITEEDCLREGIYKSIIGYYVKGLIANWEKESYTEHEDGKCYKLFPMPKDAYATLIDKINRKGTWNANTWVWRIEFELIK